VTPGPGGLQGRRALRRVLAEEAFDPRTADLEAFRRWLGQRIEHQLGFDRLFEARWALRSVLREHAEVLGPLVEDRDRAARAWEESPLAAARERAQSELARARQAVEGLDRAITAADPSRRDSLEVKRRVKAERVAEIEAELRGQEDHPLHRALRDAEAALYAAEDTVGAGSLRP
jgi:hypothetical protein